MNVTNRLVDIIFEMKTKGFSKKNLRIAKKCLLDYVGVTFAGAKILQKKGQCIISELDCKDESCTVIGYDQKSSILNASFINGLSAHVAELDDGMNSGIIHPGAPVISALLPIAEKYNVEGRKLLSSIVIGYEISSLIANILQPSHKLKGYHATGTCGTIGASVAVAYMLDYTKDEMKRAISNAVISASGMLKVLDDNSELKPYNVAKAAMNGIMAVITVKAGFNVPEDVFSGENGFLEMFSDNMNLSLIDNYFKEKLFIEKIYVKPHAACRYCHPAIDASKILRNKFEIDIEEISEIVIKTYLLAVKNHDHINVKSVSSSKMSIPFSIAVALLTGNAGINEFSTNYIDDKQVKQLLQKTKVISDEYFTKSFPKKSIAEVEIILNNGASFKERIDYPKGEPENPLTKKELEDKFKLLLAFAGRKDSQASNIISCIWGIESRASEFYGLLN